MTTRSPRQAVVRAAVTGLAAGIPVGITSALVGVPAPEALVAACLAVATVASVALAGPHAGARRRDDRLPAPRTSAGWHDVRLLADTMRQARRDPAARTVVSARIRAAMGAPPRAGTVGRAAYQADLDALRTARRSADGGPA